MPATRDEWWGHLQDERDLGDVYTLASAAQAQVEHARRQLTMGARHEERGRVGLELVDLLLVPGEVDRPVVFGLLYEEHLEARFVDYGHRAEGLTVREPEN